VMLPTPPIIIGHSMGGLVVQKYLEAHPAPAAVLLAPVPPQGVLSAALRYARRHPRAFLKGNLTLSLYPFVYPPALGRDLLFSPEFSQTEYAELAPNIQDESYCAFLDMMYVLPRPSRIQMPVLVLGAAHDQIFTEDEVKATARAYGTTAKIFPHSGHELMLDHDWRDAAESIVQWLGERSL
jgi:pimeloyl-ACP methyl ester carboxylesterase